MTSTTRSRARTAWPLIIALAVLPASVMASGLGSGSGEPMQAGAQKQSTTRDAGQIVSQPVRDVGIEKTKIPPLLIEVSKDPYGVSGAGNCRQIASGIGALTGVLGTDFSVSAAPAKRNLAKAGGAAVVNSLIPFRGLVREVSGAAPAERRLDAAIKAGFARRGFLRGLQRARGCRA